MLYVKVGILNHLEHGQIGLLTVNKTGIVNLAVQHDLTVIVSFMYYPGKLRRQRSADILSLPECHI
jgi:hypothetical protein